MVSNFLNFQDVLSELPVQFALFEAITKAYVLSVDFIFLLKWSRQVSFNKYLLTSITYISWIESFLVKKYLGGMQKKSFLPLVSKTIVNSSNKTIHLFTAGTPLSTSLLFCALFNVWKQNLSLKCAISDVFLTRCLPITFTPTSGFLFTSEHEIIFFSPNCSKLAVKCYWNTKNSQNVQNLDFLWKIDEFFFEKKLGIFENCYLRQVFLEGVSNGIFSCKCLLAQIRKNQSWKS